MAFAEKIAPNLAYQMAFKLFFSPIKFKATKAEVLCRQKAKTGSFDFMNESLETLIWGENQNGVVLVMHGWSGRVSQFYEIINQLTTNGYQVVGFNHRAHGRSKAKETSIIEFADAIAIFVKQFPAIKAAIGHSLGGVALLYAKEIHQIKVPHFITISSPSIAFDIVEVFRNKIGISAKIHSKMDAYVEKRTGHPFTFYTATSIANRLGKTLSSHLIIHDENDKEAPINNAYELNKASVNSTTFITKKLGHTRILKDETVIAQIVHFLKNG